MQNDILLYFYWAVLLQMVHMYGPHTPHPIHRILPLKPKVRIKYAFIIFINMFLNLLWVLEAKRAIY